ncbi:MAG: TonB-dependent receptor [Gammaproteobacteria bacterium]|nr:TonB-dependent receptor [Gammaproteobacteria bacterium]
MIHNSKLARAVRHSLLLGAVATCASVPAYAQDQDQASADDGVLTTVTVTGSRIRRVDEETASPVFVLSANEIQNSGVSTIGDLLQRVPAVSGAATNPQVNNGGGTGESNVELRGLGAQRTLVLLNGRRINILGNTLSSAVDINMIPLNLVERVEVLKEGAGAIYGSDAIAGVVNFITKTDWDGAELEAEFGSTAENDGDRQSVSLNWGTSTDKLNIMVGGAWSQQDEVSANDREFARFARYLSSGVSTLGGSSRTTNGRIFLPDNLYAQYGCPASSGGSVTRTAGAAGDSPDDYRCWTNDDFFNYQPFNLLMTPQERTSLFTFTNYQLTDSIQSYAEVLYTRTRSGFELAPLPFDSIADDTVISANNIYNPFGIDFGGGAGVNEQAVWRLAQIGTRNSEVSTDAMLANVGLRGSIMDSGWEWDAYAGAGRMKQDTNINGYILKQALINALGPSFLDANGTPRCGAPGAVISGCTPLNIFNLSDPDQLAALNQVSSNYRTAYAYSSRQYGASVNGDLFKLPAGGLSAAIGAEYREQEGDFDTDILTRGVPPDFLTCQLAQETCTGDSFAEYDVRELYAEVFAPLLADMPGVQSLNLSAGVRYSDYSRESIGSSTNAQYKLEYRPVSDLLLRASFAEVFRAPTIVDLSLAPSQTAPTFNDPCVGLTQAAVNANPNLAAACVNVPRDGTFEQPNSQVTGLFLGNQDLRPETGDVLTYGIVYDSSQIRGLSLTLDFWRYKIDDLITNIDPNFASEQCVLTGAAQFCDLVVRFGEGANAGLVQVYRQPTVNLGSLETDGFDIGLRYQLKDTPAGSFNLTIDATRINSYENVPSPGATPVEVAGTFDRQFGNYAEWRGLVGLGWKLQAFDALLTARYIGSLDLLDPDGVIDVAPLRIPSFTYLDLTVGYNFAKNSRVQVGGVNLTDEEPPILYQNNVTNANTDVSTYDTIGRRWYVGFTQKF